MRSDLDESVFRRKLADATAALKARNFKQAHADITEAMGLDMEAPEPHNLLGLLYEMTGDFQSARKHYRAAYALDPTYKPSCRNLERITGFESSAFFTGRVFDSAGEAPESRAEVRHA
jgi:Flp pilus assembly protein TadD